MIKVSFTSLGFSRSMAPRLHPTGNPWLLRIIRVLFLLAFPLFAQSQWQWLKPVIKTDYNRSTSVIASDDHIFIFQFYQVYHLDTNGVIAGSFTFQPGIYPSQMTLNSKDELIFSGSFTNMMVIGDTSIKSKGSHDIFVLAMDRSFNLLWIKTYGGKMEDKAPSLVVNSKDEVIVVGSVQDSVKFGNTAFVSSHYSPRLFIAKFNGQGQLLNVIKDSTYTNSPYEGYESTMLINIFINSKDEISISGWAGKMDYFSIAGYSLSVITPSASCMCSRFFVLKMDAALQPVWGISMSNSDKYSDTHLVGMTDTHVFLLNEISYYYTSSGIIVLDNNGDTINQYVPLDIPAGYSNYGTNLMCGGRFDNDFYSVGSLAYKDSLYTYTKVQVSRLRGTGFDHVASYQGFVYNSTFLKGKTACYITGYYTDWMQAGMFMMNNKGGNLYVAKLRPNLKTVDINPNDPMLSELLVYPIPVRDKVNLRIPRSIKNGRWSLCDQQGKVIRSKNISTSNKDEEIFLSDLPPGIYLLKIQGDDFISTKKIIKE